MAQNLVQNSLSWTLFVLTPINLLATRPFRHDLSPFACLCPFSTRVVSTPEFISNTNRIRWPLPRPCIRCGVSTLQCGTPLPERRTIVSQDRHPSFHRGESRSGRTRSPSGGVASPDRHPGTQAVSRRKRVTTDERATESTAKGG